MRIQFINQRGLNEEEFPFTSLRNALAEVLKMDNLDFKLQKKKGEIIGNRNVNNIQLIKYCLVYCDQGS